jgi:hypothetical protein
LNLVTSVGIAALAKLEQLQYFLYEDPKPASRYSIFVDLKKIFSLCLHLLPRLRISCCRLDMEPRGFPRHISDAFFTPTSRELPSQLGLQQLALSDSSGMPVGVALPQLQTLFLHRPREDFEVAAGLSWSLTELCLHDLQQQLLQQILFSVGHQLIKLSVSVWDTLLLDRVFQMCPKLEVFLVLQSPRDFIGLEAALRPCSLGCLSEFGFVVQKHGKRLLPGHLLQVLRAASKLRVLRLKFSDHDEQLHKVVCEALEQHSVLQNLQQLFLICEPDMGDYYYNDLRLLQNELETNSHALLCSIIDNCPKLHFVKSNSS